MSRQIPRIASRVLLVDDDNYVRDVTALILERMGYYVRATGNGFEALRWLEEEAYDLLVLDVKMPEIDGPTLYRAVLAGNADRLPALVLCTAS